MWPLVSLEEIAQINPRERSWIDLPDTTEVSFVPMQAVSEVSATIERQERRKLSEVRRGFTPFVEGDVLFAKITPSMENGKVALAVGLHNGIGFGSTEFHIIRATSLVLPEFLYFFVRQPVFRKAAKKQMRGAVGQQRVPANFLDSYQIPLPPLQEQRRIVSILHEGDQVRQLRHRANERAHDLPPALFDEMFSVDRIQMHEWGMTTISKLGEIQYGLTVNRNRREAKDKLPYLRVGNVYRWTLDLSDIATIGTLQSDTEKFRLQAGDVLVVEGHADPSQLGRAAVWNEEVPNCLHQNHLLRIRPYPELATPNYLAGCINSGAGRLHMLRYGKTSSGLGTINSSVLGDMPVLDVPVEVQNEFEKRYAAYQAVLVKTEEATAKAEALFQSLLDQAFSSQLTAVWRKQHAEELEAAAAERDRLLAAMRQERQPSIFNVNAELPTLEVDFDVESLVIQISPAVEHMLATLQLPQQFMDSLGQRLVDTQLIDSLTQGPFGRLSQQMQQIVRFDQSIVDASISRGVLELAHDTQQALAANLQPILDAKQFLLANAQPIIDFQQAIANYAQPIFNAQQLVSQFIDPIRSSFDSFRGFSLGLAEMLARAAELAEQRPDSDHPRHQFLVEISDEQYQLVRIVEEEGGYFTAESISEQYSISLNVVRGGLDLLTTAGLVIPVSLAVSPTGSSTQYVKAYRAPDVKDEVRLSDLALLEGSAQ